MGNTWKDRLDRWYKTRFKGYVIVRTYSEAPPDANGQLTTTNDRPYDCYIKYEMVKKEDLPENAKHCTGEPYNYSIDTVNRRYPRNTKQRKFTAHHAYLHMKTTVFDDANATKGSDYSHLDLKKIILIGGIIVVICVAFMILRH